MPTPVVSLSTLQTSPRPDEWLPPTEVAQRIEGRFARMGLSLGMSTLGCSLTVVPPGKSAFPLHSHRANDELFVILAGRGELRLGEARHAVAAGDLVGCPRGGPETAHQLVNTGDEELRYLAISSQLSPEICEYPDSGKVAAYADGQGGRFAHVTRRGDEAGYWDGE